MGVAVTASRVKARKKAPSLSKLAKMSWAELLGLVIGWVLRWCGRTAWRCRAGLMPIWWCVAFLVVGWVGSGWPEFWAAPISVGLVVASVLWFVGEKLSPRAQSVWMWLVPDSLDDGRKGVLDRPTERGYLCLLFLGGGTWLSARVQFGWAQDVQLALLALLVALGVPWWWHRGWRRKKPLSVWSRRWRRVDDNLDLKVWHKSKIVEESGNRAVTTLRVRLRAGLTIRHVGGDALILCSALGLRGGAITVALDQAQARSVFVRIVPRDPWRGALPHPLPALGSLSLEDRPRVAIGRYEDASEDMVKVLQHWMVVGQQGSGKSELLQNLLAWLLSYQHVAVVAADLASGATFDVWSDVFAHPVATDLHAAMDLVKRVFELIEYRELKLATMRRAGHKINVLPATDDCPAVFVIIDEFPDLIKAAAEAGVNLIRQLERCVNKSRKTNIWWVIGLQNPVLADAGSSVLRAAFTAVVGLALDEQQSKTMWGSRRSQGWDSVSLSVGTYLLADREEHHKTPRVAKSYFVSPSERARLIDAATVRPSRLAGEEAVILTGITPSPALGETARNGAYELNDEDGFTEGARPQLTVVRDVIPAPAVNDDPGFTPRPVPVSRRENLAALDGKVLHEVPPAHQGSIGASAIAAQLDVDRSTVNRSLKRLEKAGRIAPHGNGEWSCP